MIVVVLCAELSIVLKLNSIKIRDSLSIAPRIVKAIVLIEWAAINIIINVT